MLQRVLPTMVFSVIDEAADWSELHIPTAPTGLLGCFLQLPPGDIRAMPAAH